MCFQVERRDPQVISPSATKDIEPQERNSNANKPYRNSKNMISDRDNTDTRNEIDKLKMTFSEVLN